MADHDENRRCLVESNVSIAFILPSRWQDGADSLGMETTAVYAFGYSTNPFLIISS